VPKFRVTARTARPSRRYSRIGVTSTPSAAASFRQVAGSPFVFPCSRSLTAVCDRPANRANSRWPYLFNLRHCRKVCMVLTSNPFGLPCIVRAPPVVRQPPTTDGGA
jgi:hypothetical protein